MRVIAANVGEASRNSILGPIADKKDILLVNQQDIVGGMRGMTAAAIARLYRHTQTLVFGIVDGPFLQPDSVFMTLAAGVEHGIFQKVFLFRAMGIVAIQTPNLIR